MTTSSRRSTATASAVREHQLEDGATVVVRPLQATDRDELRLRYEQLSESSRRLRFFSAPTHLTDQALDRLLDVDFVDRVALVAVMVDEPGSPATGIARFARSREDSSAADAAVTVMDSHQGRGIGTILLHDLTDVALQMGISTFTGDVMWENRELLDGLRAAGAVVEPSEPGMASVAVSLPPVFTLAPLAALASDDAPEP